LEQNVQKYRWMKITDEADFAPRDGAGALVFRGRLWLLGGWNPRDKAHFPRICNSEVWSSVDGAKWHLENAQAPWEGRHTAGYCVFKDRMLIIGGDANQRHYQSDVWASSDGRSWERIADCVPWGPRVLHYTVTFNERIWVMGGQTVPQFAPAKEVFHCDVWNSEDGVSWDRVAASAPWESRGMIGGAAVFRNLIWILGGGTYDTPGTPRRKFLNDVWSSADGKTWECQTVAAPWAPRQYHDVAVFDNRLWVLEGYNANGGNRSDVWHSADGIAWTEIPDTPWPARHAASVFVYNDSLWMVAGNNMTSDVWRLTRES
jgi:hypothetical protein